jgi:hypothetical protein
VNHAEKQSVEEGPPMNEATNLKDDSKTGDNGAGVPVPATSATGTPSAGKHEPISTGKHEPVGQASGDQEETASIKVTEVDDNGSAGPGEGTGGDAGSGPTGAVTPDDIGVDESAAESEAESEAGDGSSSGGLGPLPMSLAAFIAGLVTGVLAGWFAAR